MNHIPHTDAFLHDPSPPQHLLDPVQIKGFAVTYDRKFNLGNYESVAPSITIWVRNAYPDGDLLDLHTCKERVREMARNNVRAQLQYLKGQDEVVYLGLPPLDEGKDPLLIRTVSVGLIYKVNGKPSVRFAGDFHMITPAFTDWADLRLAAHSTSDIHLALTRMWASLWANTLDEIARAKGQPSAHPYFGLPDIEVEDLTSPNGRSA